MTRKKKILIAIVAAKVVQYGLAFYFLAKAVPALGILLMVLDPSYPPYAGTIGQPYLEWLIHLVQNRMAVITWFGGIVLIGAAHYLGERLRRKYVEPKKAGSMVSS